MLDWPGRMASTIFLDRCNFRCPYCHNPELVTGFCAKEIPIKNAIAYLYSRKRWVDCVVVTGGEPTFSTGLEEFLERIKKIGLLIKLDTNGSKPRVIKNLISKRLVDFIALDVKSDFSHYPIAVGAPVDIEAIKASINLVLKSKIDCEFRMTVVPEIIDFDVLKKAAKEVSALGVREIVLQQFRPTKTLNRSFMTIKPYKHEILLDMKESISRYIRVKIRGA